MMKKKKNFYDWLYNNTKYINNYDSLLKIHDIFNIHYNSLDISFSNFKINKKYNTSYLRNVMQDYGMLIV